MAQRCVGGTAAQRTLRITGHVAPEPPVTGDAVHAVTAVARPSPAASARRSAAVPASFSTIPGEDDAEIAAHLAWMMQKDSLGQDVLLLGPPGALRRQLALHYCELLGREAEVLTVTRDTTEADLKQRRELSTGPGGSRTLHVDGAPVRCALHGRVLILDGLEKAERNVLPTLNNLLENREMALDDGRFLVPARRYDMIVADHTDNRDTFERLLRVHENFRVIALALPCPPFVGNPLDPPLRSRFQARVVGPPTLSSVSQLGELGSSMTEVLLRRLSTFQRALNMNAFGGNGLSGGDTLASALAPGARLPALSHDATLRIIRMVSGAGVLPRGARPSVAEALKLAYPLALITLPECTSTKAAALEEALATWIKHFQLNDGGEGNMTKASLKVHVKPCSIGGVVHLAFGCEGEAVPLASPGLPAAPRVDFVLSQPLQQLSVAVARDFALGHDCLLVGPAGCGKSAFARHVAALLGHGEPGGDGLEYFFLFEEMSSRDLLQRRTTDADGRTSWIDSPLVRAARRGALCVLDGVHRLRGDVLCALAPLLQDRQASLSVANHERGAQFELLLREDRFTGATAPEDTKFYDAEAKCLVARIHPAFRVLALAEPPTLRTPWLGDELATYFSHHSFPTLSSEGLAEIVATLSPQLTLHAVERLVAAVSPSHFVNNSSPEAAFPVPLRVMIRVARQAAAAHDSANVDVEMLTGILQQALFPFMPAGERTALLEKLRGHFGRGEVDVAATRALRRGGATQAAALAGAAKERESAETKAAMSNSSSTDMVRIGTFIAPLGRPQRPELVPCVDFVGIDRHIDLLDDLARAMFQRGDKHLLLLGPQGVGKNRVVDHLLQSLRLEREYMQLHRDTTVAQLTVMPAIVEGRLVYEDSPLVRAARHGRVLVLDEADKAPLEVVVVLKSLVEDGQLALSDGRRLARVSGAVELRPGSATMPIHPDFRMIVLANRPGFPFLGNDLIREADVFTVFCLDNPDAESEIQLVRSIAPRVPDAVLRTLVTIFSDLRIAVEEGRLQYPYSTRELLAVVRHLDRFPNESLESALASILAFDRFDQTVRETLRPIFERRGVPISAALGGPLDDMGGTLELREPWLRALAALLSVRLAATTALAGPLPAGSWGTRAPIFLDSLHHDVSSRPIPLDLPQTTPLGAVSFSRVEVGFSELVVHSRLPLRSGNVVDAVAARGDRRESRDGSKLGGCLALHLLSLRPLTLWTIEDPLSVGADAGRCTCLPIGPGSDWAIRFSEPTDGAQSPREIAVNGRSFRMGTPQLQWVSGLDAVLFHSPLDSAMPLLLVERPHREDVCATAIVVPPLASTTAGRTRLKADDTFVLVPVSSQELNEAVGVIGQGIYSPMNSAIFFQPSGRRLLQVDFAGRVSREVVLDGLLAEQGWLSNFLERLRGAGTQNAPFFSVTAAATPLGSEVLLSWQPSNDGVGSTRFLALLLPHGTDGAHANSPSARWIDATSPLSAGVAVPGASEGSALLPAVIGADGLLTTLPGTLGTLSFAATPPTVGLAHVLSGSRENDTAHELQAFCEEQQAHETVRGLSTPANSAAATVAELAKADDITLDRLLLSEPPRLPAPRLTWHTRDITAPAATDLIVRALEHDGDAERQWLEAVHTPTRTVRRLPARSIVSETSAAGRDKQRRSKVSRVLPFPSPGSPVDTCVAFEDGTVQWLELHPNSLARSFREYLEVRGLRGLLQGENDDKATRVGREGEAKEIGDSRAAGETTAAADNAGPEGVRDELLAKAKKQRQRLLEAKKRGEFKRETSRDASGNPKHGEVDDEEHVGGNRFAGGSGGADTAGLGGKGGPYRLEKRGQSVHQISDEAKAQISEEAKEAARKMGEEARLRRLAEIEMDGGDYDLYTSILGDVKGEIEQLRRVLSDATAKQKERVWHRGVDGELDENRIVDAIAGESAVFKRRAERESRPGDVLLLPKRICFLFDSSASMYRFNGTDGRLRRSAEALVMLMEALSGFEQKFDYQVCCHDGDHVLNELVTFGRPPANERDRLKVVSKMMAAAQFCSSGDNTLAAIERACEQLATSGPADDYFVFAFSDANFGRYGITPSRIGAALRSQSTVNANCFLIASLDDEAVDIARRMPDQVKLCLDLRTLPAAIRQQFVSSVTSRGRVPASSL
eukprot:TRINITY_DN17055_c0_g1_i1.p1 TRINITY_DN17055_c0_g1~~TRINITY_DN17055_c0_g1_i1.p1  ORF type:complete len:2144 (+),score=329.32 TRINITY_DN17055_c0_g1_i1:237-6668(+)